MRSKGMTLFFCGETRTELQGTRTVINQSNSVPISRVVLELVAAKTAANRRQSYLRSLRVYLEGFARGREDMPITAVNLKLLEEWYASRTETPSMRKGTIGRLSTMFSYAWRKGYVTENPCKRLERIRVDPKPPRIFTPLQARTLLHYLRGDRRRRWRLAQAILGLFCGVRPTELTRLFWKDIDLERAIVRIDASASKVRQRRIVPIPENAIAWLKLCERHEQKIGAVRWKWIEAAERKTGLKWENDILRHTAASYLVAKHEDCGRVARWLGNSADVLLRHYTELVSAEDCLAFWSIRP